MQEFRILIFKGIGRFKWLDKVVQREVSLKVNFIVVVWRYRLEFVKQLLFLRAFQISIA